MKKLSFIYGALLALCFSACNAGRTNSSTSENDSIQVDSLAAYLQKMDSINNSGKLIHLHVFELGKIKSIDFQVVRIESETDSIEYINLRKDCGGEYYYDWENASLLVEEVKYLTSAIDTIANNLDRPVSNEERYIYITKDDIRVFSKRGNNDKNWYAELSIDYQKKNSSISVNKEDLETLKSLLHKGEQKIIELRK